MDWINYHQLLNFWLVAREGSVRRASELLNVTPSSVSIQIRHLERAFGAELFSEAGARTEDDGAGPGGAGLCRRDLCERPGVVELVKGRPIGRPLALRIGIRDVMSKLVAFRLLKPALQMEVPIRLICQEGQMSELISDLVIHKLDAVFSDTALDPLYRVQAYSHLLGESDVVIVGVRDLVRRFAKGFPSSLDGAPFVLPVDSSALRRHMDRWFTDLNLTPNVRGEFADSAMLKIAGSMVWGCYRSRLSLKRTSGKLYGLQRVGIAAGVREQFYAISVERRLKHPG